MDCIEWIALVSFVLYDLVSILELTNRYDYPIKILDTRKEEIERGEDKQNG